MPENIRKRYSETAELWFLGWVDSGLGGNLGDGPCVRSPHSATPRPQRLVCRCTDDLPLHRPCLFAVRRSFGCVLCSVVQKAKAYRSALPRTTAFFDRTACSGATRKQKGLDSGANARHLLQRSADRPPKTRAFAACLVGYPRPPSMCTLQCAMARHRSWGWVQLQHSGPCSSAKQLRRASILVSFFVHSIEI